ncbi:putative transcription factor interactor and regulator C3H-WRC/GRF family [Helianthus annuus]|nr:putative transcription factor interactor and regulator C3H-WRC/GRF family [Helianthus annuus]KAJ0775083.1 putative transcription factor interactor and regulator C3H-WRC/GRF family [Helianthus annuus]
MVNGNQSAAGGGGGVVRVSGKVFFTANQWEELERQTTIYKYIMASIPVPPQLLVSLSTQSNRMGMGLRLSNGSDPEPWRCRRTDGKKWRCAKDVAPDQRYCERHARKTRSRSRKPVETAYTKDTSTVVSAANQQPECSDWLKKNAGIPAYQSTSNNQFQQPTQSAIGGSKRDQISKQDYKEIHQQNSLIDHNNSYLNASFTGIDGWSRIGGGDECSLTLSMQSGGNQMEFDHESFQMAVGLLSGDRDGCEDVFKPHHNWLNQASWAGLGSGSGSGSTPGGPLGEALCLGITSTRNEPSYHGYSSNTNSSSACEGGGLNFVNRRDG